jgi:hypothetical protein
LAGQSIPTFRREAVKRHDLWVTQDERRRPAESGRHCRSIDAHERDDAEGPISAWNERPAKRLPMLLTSTIGAACETTKLSMPFRAPDHQRHLAAKGQDQPAIWLGRNVVAALQSLN